MTAPIRIQLSRKKGWRMPPNTVKVSRPGKWGNPFRIGETVQRFSKEKICETIHIGDAATAVSLFRDYYEAAFARHPELMCPAFNEIRGKNLACWCALDAPCHADVLLDLANK